jgi:hypothetical protein
LRACITVALSGVRKVWTNLLEQEVDQFRSVARLLRDVDIEERSAQDLERQSPRRRGDLKAVNAQPSANHPFRLFHNHSRVAD